MKQTGIESSKIVHACNFYMEREEHSVSKQDFIDNMEKKALDKEFVNNMQGLLRAGILYDAQEAYKFIEIELLEKV